MKESDHQVRLLDGSEYFRAWLALQSPRLHLLPQRKRHVLCLLWYHVVLLSD